MNELLGDCGTSAVLPLGALVFLEHAYLSQREGHGPRCARDPIFCNRREQRIQVSFQSKLQQEEDSQKLSQCIYCPELALKGSSKGLGVGETV